MTAPVLIASSTASIASGAGNLPLVANFPAGCLRDDVLIARVVVGAVQVPGTPTTWRAFGSVSTGVVAELTRYKHTVALGESAATTVSWNVAANHNAIVMIECWRNLAENGNPGNNTTTTTASGTTQNAPALTVTAGINQVMFADWVSVSTSTFSGPPAGFTLNSQFTALGLSVASAAKVLVGIQATSTGLLAITTNNAGVGVGASYAWPPEYMDWVQPATLPN